MKYGLSTSLVIILRLSDGKDYKFPLALQKVSCDYKTDLIYIELLNLTLMTGLNLDHTRPDCLEIKYKLLI